MYLLLTVTLLSFSQPFLASSDSAKIAQLRGEFQSQIQALSKTQAARIDSLKIEIAELNTKVNFYESAAKWLMGIIAFISVTAVWGFVRRQTKKFNDALDKAIYRSEPRDMPVNLPASGMEKQLERLRQLDFYKLTTHPWLDDTCTKNCVVHLATEEQHAEDLKQFIDHKKLKDRADVVFVVYTKGAQFKSGIFTDYDNVTMATNHLTLVQALFVAARGMIR